MIQELDQNQFVGFGSSKSIVGSIILSFLFQNREYKCKTLDEKATLSRPNGPRHASPCIPLVMRVSVA
jgi:hypothetical protein